MSEFLVPQYRLPSVLPQGRLPASQGAEAPAGAFGTDGRQLQQAGQNLQQTGDVGMAIYQREAAIANQTRVQELSNQFVAGSQGILYTNPDAYLTKQGSEAIHGAKATTDALNALRASIMGQVGNSAQLAGLRDRLDTHFDSATNMVARHVAQQSLVWQKATAEGTVTNGANAMVLDYNDPAKVDLHANGIWKTKYDVVLKETGSPEAATAQANAVRSNAFRQSLTLLANQDPGAAQRQFDAHRDWIDASDAPVVAKTIKDAAEHRTTQNIVSVVTATGGVSPNYNSKVGGTENGGSYQGENKIGALGKYQMTKDTYTELAQGMEWGKGKSQAEIRQMLLDPKEGPGRQDQLQKGYVDSSISKLRAAGVPVNDLTLYTTHFLGRGAGPELLKLPDDTPLQAGLIKAHGGDAAYVQKVNDANPFLAKVQTVGDFKALMAQKIGAPSTLAVTGSPEKPNLDAMLAAGMALAGDNPDLRDKVSNAIKTDYATRLAIYTAQKTDLEKQAYAHIDSGGSLDNLPAQIRGGLDADGLNKVGIYEERRLEKVRKLKGEEAQKGLADLEKLGQLTPEDVDKRRTNLTGAEYRSWQKVASGKDRTDDAGAYERLQRGLGTRDMRDDIFAAHNSGDISNETRNAMLDKNATFLKEGAPATPYKINHDRITHALEVGIADNPIARELFGKAIKEYDQYVAANPQREGETREQFGKRLSDYSEDTVRRYTMIKMQDSYSTKAIPAHASFNRPDMMNLPKPEATKKIAAANGELSKKFADGLITEEQYNRDAIALMDWLDFVQKRPETPAAKK